MSRFASVQPIGERPGLDPEPDGYPCAICKAKAAARLSHDALEMLTDDDAFPKEALREFLDRFGETFKEMASFLYDEGYDHAMRDDNDYCYEHRPTRDDEE